MWAENVTFTFGKTNRDVSSTSPVTKNTVTVTVTQNGAANAPNFSSDASDVRFQDGNKMTIACEGDITQVVLTYTTAAYASKITQSSFNVGTYSYTSNSTTGTWTGSTNSLEIINKGGSQSRISQIVVTYSPAGEDNTIAAIADQEVGILKSFVLTPSSDNGTTPFTFSTTSDKISLSTTEGASCTVTGLAVTGETDAVIVVGQAAGTHDDTNYKAATPINVNVSVVDNRTTPGISFSAAADMVSDGEQTITVTTTHTGNKSVTSSNENIVVASVNGSGNIDLLAGELGGTATITLTIAENGDYKEATNSFTVNVDDGKSDPTVTISSDEVDIFKSKTITISSNSAGAITPTMSSDYNDYATFVDNEDGTFTLTGKAVGTVKVNIAQAANGSYRVFNRDYDINVVDNRTSVNMSSFTTENTTIYRGSTVETSVTNDQGGWSAAYTYSSSNTDVATVAADGKITAVAAGNATITATLNVSATDETYKPGATTSKTIDITVAIPSHTVTFSINGSTRTAEVQEDAVIPFPTAVTTTPADATEFDKVINGQTFVGWFTDEYTNASVAPEYVSTSTLMPHNDVTYYAVYADVEEEESDDLADAVKSQTLQYDTWTYSGSTTDKSNNSYRLFHSGSYIESEAFDLTKLMKVIVYGGTFGGGSYNSLTIGDGTNVWKNVTVSGSSETGTNTYTGGTALSGTKPLRVICNSGTASSSGVRISKVEIYTKGVNVSYSNFTTTVSLLPRPEITMADVEMTWGDNDKSVAPTATVASAAYEGTFTYESSSVNLIVALDGKLTCNVPGDYTVTAKIAATANNQAAEKTCNVTVGKQNITLNFANAEVTKMVSDETYTQTVTVSPVAYDGTITYSKDGNATINSSTAKVDFTTTGVNTITATAPATELYNGNTASYTLYVKTTPTITVSNQTKAVGETYTPTIEGGAVTITSSPAGVITVEGNVITAAAIVTGATIKVETAANDTYIAGEATFTLTVTGPEGLNEIPEPDDEIIFNETFNGYTGLTGGNDGNFSAGSGDYLTAKNDESGWVAENAYGASQCIRYGSSSKLGKATTRALGEEGTLTLTFKAAAWNGNSESTTLKLSVNEGTLSQSTVTMSKTAWTNYEVTISNATEDTKVTFQGNANSNSRFFLDEVMVTKPADPISSVSVTIPSSGYCSYCSMYPLNLPADNDNCKAYVATSVNGELVTLKRVRGEIKGGVPLIFIGTPNSYDIPTAEASTTVPYEDSNLLRGTLAPTYVTQSEGDYTNLGLSGSVFKKINSGVVPANKAYLHIPTSMMPASGARMNIFIDDDDDVPTGVKSIDNRQLIIDNTVYNLKGQRVEKPVKGQLYIVNGKKVVIK